MPLGKADTRFSYRFGYLISLKKQNLDFSHYLDVFCGSAVYCKFYKGNKISAKLKTTKKLNFKVELNQVYQKFNGKTKPTLNFFTSLLALFFNCVTKNKNYF